MFRFEFINNLAKLDERKLPEHKDIFFSKLKNSSITEVEYVELRKVWEQQ